VFIIGTETSRISDPRILKCFAIVATCRNTPQQGRLDGIDSTRSVRRAQIQPQRGIVPEHPPNLAEPLDQLSHVLDRRGLKAELLVNATGAATPAITPRYVATAAL
jgi:hypothetical protein